MRKGGEPRGAGPEGAGAGFEGLRDAGASLQNPRRGRGCACVGGGE